MAYLLILPEIGLTLLALGLLLLDLIVTSKWTLAYLGLLGIAAVLLAIWPSLGLQTEIFSRMLVVDGYAVFFKVVFMAIAALIFFSSITYVEKTGIHVGEFYVLLLCATLGMMLMASSYDLITIYLGLELLSISSYVLAGMLRDDPKSHEAAIKYFLTGAMASAILLFGMSLVFGITGSTHLADIARGLSGPAQFQTLIPAAVVALVAGFGFKVAAVPFHMWAPDTYEGAPTPVTAFLSVGSKGAAFAALLRVFMVGLSGVASNWTWIFAILAVLTMTLGNVTALLQRNVKRMLAYSSIAHAGYILVGLAVASPRSLAAMLYYVLAYAFMNIGAFAVVTMLTNNGLGEDIEDYAGLSQRAPVSAAFMVVFFLSLIGIPFTAGFFGKFFLFSAAIEEGLTWLAVAIAINSAISVGYYYAVVRNMYLVPPAEGSQIRVDPAMQLALVLSVAGTLGLGLWAEPFLRWVSMAAAFKP